MISSYFQSRWRIFSPALENARGFLMNRIITLYLEAVYFRQGVKYTGSANGLKPSSGRGRRPS